MPDPSFASQASRVRGEKPRWGVVDAVSMNPYLAGGRLWRRSQPTNGVPAALQ
jgi:hypothetical protein